MTCDRAIELLPWLLNGTLESGERAEVWSHLETCASCRRSLAETREAWSVFAQHLPSQDLVTLAWGEAPSEAVEEHLASCARCAAELELARMSRRLEEEENVVLFPAAKPRPAAAPRRWQVAAVAASLLAAVSAFGWLQAGRRASELSTQPAAVEAARPAAPGAPAEDPASPRQRLARLEGDMKRLVGLSQENERQLRAAQEQVAALEEQRQALSSPRATSMLDLGSGDVVRGEGPQRTIARDQYVTLLLPAREDGQAAPRRAEIADSSGKILWQASRLPVTQGYHSLVLPPGSLPPGRYTLRLSGLEESWTFDVAP
jgi:hypothetical protein